MFFGTHEVPIPTRLDFSALDLFSIPKDPVSFNKTKSPHVDSRVLSELDRVGIAKQPIGLCQ